MTELQRVLAALDFQVQLSRDLNPKASGGVVGDAARLLRAQAEALRTIAERIAEEHGGCPEWWHNIGCPEDDTCDCPHAVAVTQACRLLGPEDDAARERWALPKEPK